MSALDLLQLQKDYGDLEQQLAEKNKVSALRGSRADPPAPPQPQSGPGWGGENRIHLL